MANLDENKSIDLGSDASKALLARPNRYIEGIEALANLTLMSTSRDAVNEYITKPIDVKTPP